MHPEINTDVLGSILCNYISLPGLSYVIGCANHLYTLFMQISVHSTPIALSCLSPGGQTSPLCLYLKFLKILLLYSVQTAEFL